MSGSKKKLTYIDSRDTVSWQRKISPYIYIIETVGLRYNPAYLNKS